MQASSVVRSRGFARAAGMAASLAAVIASSGCTSPLTSIALREFLREAANSVNPLPDDDEAILAARDAEPSAEEDDAETPNEALAESSEESDETAPKEPLEDAIERSLARLAKTPGLDAIGRDLIIETLEKSNPEDWPAIIDSFAASLETTANTSSMSGDAPMPKDEPATAKAAAPKKPGGLTIPVNATLPAADPTPQVVAAVHLSEQAAPSSDAAVEAEPAAETEAPEDLVASLRRRLAEAQREAPLTIRRACFASKVRGWGSLDAFPEAKFVPGQDVLVYVELDNIAGDDVGGGWSSKVEAAFRLVDGEGRVVKQWSFPSVEDRADAPRTDYFVRYLLTMPPEADPGGHRLEVVVTDTVASKKATTDLPVEIAAH